MDNILQEKKALEEKIALEELNTEKYNYSFLMYLIGISTAVPFNSDIQKIIVLFIIFKFCDDYKKYKYHIGKKILYENQLNELKKIHEKQLIESKSNCEHKYCYNEGYYFLTEDLYEISTENKQNADFRRCKCLMCDEEIDLFKSLNPKNPDWDIIYNVQEIKILQKKKIKK